MSQAEPLVVGLDWVAWGFQLLVLAGGTPVSNLQTTSLKPPIGFNWKEAGCQQP